MYNVYRRIHAHNSYGYTNVHTTHQLQLQKKIICEYLITGGLYKDLNWADTIVACWLACLVIGY